MAMYTLLYMDKLERKQVYLAPKQAKRVKLRAKQEAVAEAVIIRRALDLGLDQLGQAVDKSQQKARKAVIAAVDKRIQAGTTKGKRTWQREDLYDDRLGR